MSEKKNLFFFFSSSSFQTRENAPLHRALPPPPPRASPSSVVRLQLRRVSSIFLFSLSFSFCVRQSPTILVLPRTWFWISRHFIGTVQQHQVSLGRFLAWLRTVLDFVLGAQCSSGYVCFLLGQFERLTRVKE